MKNKFMKKILISSLCLFGFCVMQMQTFHYVTQDESVVCVAQLSEGKREVDLLANPKTSLKEIAKPYLGVYECESLYFGGENKKDIFEYLRVELNPKNELLVGYKLKKGESGKVKLDYEYDFKEKTLHVTGQWMIFKMDRKFPLENGEIRVVMNLFGKLVNVKFSKK